jgi:ornithine cyclodeaminase/alanine dehydrogenase-like protein (mu-crystallin family)
MSFQEGKKTAVNPSRHWITEIGDSIALFETPPHAALLKDAPEIADLVSCKVPGRMNDDQITIFANGGHGWGLDGGPGYGIQFTAVAKLVYDLAREKGLGRELPLDWFAQNVNS